MMPYLTYDESVKAFVKVLRKSSGLDKSAVLNADTMRGAQAGSTICKNIFSAPTADNCFIIFELLEDNTASLYGVSSITDKLYEVLTTYVCHIKVYGLNSHAITYKTIAGFKSSAIATEAREEGIYINGVSKITQTNEFINNTLWLRCDFDISIQCKHKIDLSTTIPTIDKEIISVKNLNIITK